MKVNFTKLKKTFIIAEIGVNHNGKFNTAKKIRNRRQGEKYL